MLFIYTNKKYLKIMVMLTFIFGSIHSIATNEGINKFPKIWNVSNYNYNFEGRFDKINEIINLMQNNNKIISIVGIGGIGKTQLVKKIAELSKQNYKIVWWFDAKKKLDPQMKELALHWNEYIAENQKEFIDVQNLPTEKVIEKLKNNLRITNLKFLLIFDDVDTMDDIKNYLPIFHNENRSHVMLTSKNAYISDKVIKLGKFNRDESVKLLMKLINNITFDEANKLAAELCDYPLSLSQGASYIKSHPSVNAAMYIELLQKEPKTLWQEEEKMKKNENQIINNGINDYENTVVQTMNITIDAVKNHSKDAYNILILCALLNSKNIPEELLFEFSKEDKNSIYNAISVLEQHSVIDKNVFSNNPRSTKTTYTIHEITQKVILNNISEKELKGVLQQVVKTMVAIAPNKIDFLITFLTENPFYIHHLEKIKEHCHKIKMYNSEILELNQRILEYYLSGMRNFEKAEILLKDMEFIKSKVKDISIPLSLRFDVMKATLLAWKYYDIKGSIETLGKASQIAQYLNDFPEEQLMVFNRLVQEYLFIGDIENAEKYSNLGQKVIENAKEFVGNQDTFYFARTKMAIDKGDLDEALHNLKMNMTKTANLFPNMPFTAKVPALTLEIDILNRSGDYNSAHNKSKHILESASKYIENKNHVFFARIKTYLGISYLRLGEIKKAKKEATESIAIFQKADNYANSRFKITALLLLAEVYSAENNYIEEQNALFEAEKITNKIYTHYKIDDISKMYASIVKNSVNLNDNGLAQHYLALHKKIFGFSNKRTIELIDFLNSKDSQSN